MSRRQSDQPTAEHQASTGGKAQCDRGRPLGYTPAMIAITLCRIGYQGLSDWRPVRTGGYGVIGYAGAGGRAFVRAEEVDVLFNKR